MAARVSDTPHISLVSVHPRSKWPPALRGECSWRSLPAGKLVAALLVIVLLGGGGEVRAQFDFSDEPLLSQPVSDRDVDLRGRWVRQWRDDAGDAVLLFDGGFELNFAGRRLSSESAVVWIRPHVSAERGRNVGRTYQELTVYLSGRAEVREPAGTVTTDTVLLVRGLRTFGRVVKLQQAYAPEPLTDSPLYAQAVRDRAALAAAAGDPGRAPDVFRPDDPGLAVREPSRVIRYRLPNIEPALTPGDTPQRVFVATGGVYFAQDGGPNAPLLEIRADHAVVFPAAGSGALVGAALSAPLDDNAAPADTPPVPPVRDGVPDAPGALLGLGAAGDSRGQIEVVYLEGDVVLSLGDRFIRAERLVYDFARSRALILDAVFRAELPDRGIPLYLRAAELRQLSATEFSAENARVSTSEFYTPTYHIGAEHVYLRDATERDAEGRATGPLAAEYEMRDTTVNIDGQPIFWWPYSKGRLEATETMLRRIRTGYSSDRGYEFQSAWFLYNLLGVTAPEGYDATLLLDYFSERGPGVGMDFDYETPDYYGLVRTYFIHDQGEDSLGPARRDERVPSSPTRGRALFRHRHYLPYDWELTLEGSYVSDPNFLEEYRRSEWFEGKEQETAIYLKRAKGNEALTFLSNWRLNDFQTQTEHLPEAAYRRIGDTFLNPLVLYHESRIGMVRWRPDERHDIRERLLGRPRPSDATFRVDARQEAELPLKLGALNLVPFASVRGTFWDGQDNGQATSWRGLAAYGIRGSTSFSRVYEEVESELLDIHRLRHIIKPDFAVWWGHSNTRSELYTPFDYGIETIDGFYGMMLGLRQVWQTQRGLPGDRRTVDLLTLNLEFGLFGDTDGREDFSNGYANPFRPENSRTRNYFAGDLMYRLSDSTAFLYDFNFDLNDRSFDRHNASFVVERSPRLAYIFGTRYAGDVELAAVGGGWNYKISEKHLTTTRAWWDVNEGALGEVSITYVRKLPRWYVGVSFEYENVDNDFSVSFSLWPEGVPEWAIGSRRYTSLTESTGIRP